MAVETLDGVVAAHVAAAPGPQEIALTIQGATIRATSPEGQVATMGLQRLAELLARQGMSTCGTVLPDGVKLLESRGPVSVWVHESPPRVYSFKWIAGDSAAPFGQGTKYRIVRIALPYLIVLVVFEPHGRGAQQLSGRNECFFRVAPLSSGDDELLFPALLNCSKFTPPHGKPLSWICTAQMNRAAIAREPDTPKRLRAGFHALLQCLLETGFNYSSEHHEGASWFTESARVDPRIASVEAWEKATEHDPLFVLDVPWLKTGLGLRQVLDRIFLHSRAHDVPFATARDAARLVFNHGGE